MTPLSRRTFLLSPAVLAALRAQPPRLARKDSFFGLHFDLHPSPEDQALGRDLSEEMIENLLAKVKPDFVQYDSKGHVGYLGFPSALGTSAPHIAQDSLALWRKVTARRGVALYIHFSGVWDSQAIQKHPDWARGRPDGQPEPNQTSTFGPYVDELMLPELKEAAHRYDLDGAWVDGECWATNPDYSPAAARAFGRQDLPKGPQDPGWLEFLEFNREQFRKYVRHYVEALHRDKPGFQVASNWLYSTMVPERPDLPVDFLSGDYLGNGCISQARLEARYLAQNGKPWDLMAWGFQMIHEKLPGVVHKPDVQLQQEAAVVLAQGGGFQIYYQPTRTGRVDDHLVNTMSHVAQFCRARQRWCHKSESVPQIGVLLSTASLYHTTGRLFGGWGDATAPAAGMIDALVESHYPVDVIPEWKIEEAARLYPCLVVPDWPEAGPRVSEVLSSYVRKGGRLLLAGAEMVREFQGLAGVRLGEVSAQEAYIPIGDGFANLSGRWQDAELAGAGALGLRYGTYDALGASKLAASLNRVEKGQVAAIYGPVGKVHGLSHAPAVRRFVAGVMDRLFTPVLELEAPPCVEAVLRRKDGATVVHLLNLANMQVAQDYAAVDYVPPLSGLRISLRLPAAPRKATLQPEGRPIQAEWSQGVWRATLDRLDLHTMIVMES